MLYPSQNVLFIWTHFKIICVKLFLCEFNFYHCFILTNFDTLLFGSLGFYSSFYIKDLWIWNANDWTIMLLVGYLFPHIISFLLKEHLQGWLGPDFHFCRPAFLAFSMYCLLIPSFTWWLRCHPEPFWLLIQHSCYSNCS